MQHINVCAQMFVKSKMSRARLVCSDILSRMSPVNQFEEKAVLSSQDIVGKDRVFNLYIPNENPDDSPNDSPTDCQNTEHHYVMNCEVSEDECQMSVDDWLKQRNIVIDSIEGGCTSGIGYSSIDGGSFLTGHKDPGMCPMELEMNNGDGDESDEKKTECLQSNSLVLDTVDPLLNVPVLSDALIRNKSNKCDWKNLLSGKELETVSDCDINMCKGRMWDTLSIASRRSDCDVENNTDFADFNLLSYTFDTNDIGALEPMHEHVSKNIEPFMKSTNSVTFELDQDINFDSIPVHDVSSKTLTSISFKQNKLSIHNKNTKKNKHRSVLKPRIRELDGDPLLMVPSKLHKNINADEIYQNVLDENDDTQDIALFDLKNAGLLPKDNPSDSDYNVSSEDMSSVIEPILKDTLNSHNHSRLDDLSKEEIKVMKQHRISEIGNMTGSVAMVTNCTVNIAKPKTRMVIITDKGDERYEGNTADLMQPLGSRKKDRTPVPPIYGKHIITSVRTAATIKEEVSVRGAPKYKPEPDDALVREMLTVLGITDDMLYTILTNFGLRVWVCPEHECRRIFNRLHTLKTHILGHYGLKPFKCDYPNCPWSFYTSFKLKRHRETHLKKKNFICTVPECNRTFTTIYNLNTHLKLHDRPARLKCLVGTCSFRFQTVRAMEKHLKTHEDSLAPYRCKHPGCTKFYFSFSSLNAHARCHQHKQEELTCQWQGCGRIFDKPCRLKAHMRQHTGDKPYVCNYQDCKWAFSSSSKLKRHQHKHIGERRFRCTIGDCTKAFMRSEHLKDHTLTHIGSRTFQCPYCGESFGAKATLYVHKKKLHSLEVGKNNNYKNTSSTANKIKNEPTQESNMNDPLEIKINNEKRPYNTSTLSTSVSSINIPISNITVESIKAEKSDDSVGIISRIFDSEELLRHSPTSPIILKSISEDYEFNSFREEFSSLEDIEPLAIPLPKKEETETNKQNTNHKKASKGKSKLIKKPVKKLKKGLTGSSESCARTYLAYHSIDTPEVSEITRSEMNLVPVSIEAGPSHITYPKSKAKLPSINNVPLISDAGSSGKDHSDTGLSDVDSFTGDNTLSDGITLSDTSSEMLINTDLLQDSQQPIFLSNLVLQDETGSDLFGSEGGSEYILLLDSSANTNFSESTINLKDLD